MKEERKKENNKKVDWGEVDLVSDRYDSANLLTISSQDTTKEWILDFGCLFHMCPNRA